MRLSCRQTSALLAFSASAMSRALARCLVYKMWLALVTQFKLFISYLAFLIDIFVVIGLVFFIFDVHDRCRVRGYFVGGNLGQ